MCMLIRCLNVSVQVVCVTQSSQVNSCKIIGKRHTILFYNLVFRTRNPEFTKFNQQDLQCFNGKI